MAALAAVVVLAMPIAVVVGLLGLATVMERRREEVVARQVALTDAIHGAMGPVVAPVVRRGRGGWVGVLAVPVGQPDLGLMVAIAQAQLGPTAKIVLVSPDQGAPARSHRATAAPALAA